MKKKIFLYYIVLTVIGISITAFFTSQLARDYYTKEVNQRLINIGSMINHDISLLNSSNGNFDFNNYSKTLAASLDNESKSNYVSNPEHIRITFIKSTGTVLGESDTNYMNMENHLSRSEVKQALKGTIGKNIRYSSTLKTDFLYIAMPLDNNDIIVRISVPLTQLSRISKFIFLYSLLAAIFVILLTSLLALKFSSSITSPINDLISVLQDITHGNYTKRVHIKSKDEIGQLATSLNKMTDKLENTVEELVEKNARVDSIINSILNGIIAVDREERIIFINDISCSNFSITNQSSAVGQKFIEVIRNPHINDMISKTISKNISITNEIKVSYPEEHIYKVYTNPMRANQSNDVNSGSIIFIMDITNIRKLEQIRTEFVSNVTHELKTPLTSIRGYIETLRNGAIDDKTVADRFLEIIDIEAERLYILINDILQLSEIETKQSDTNIAPHNLYEIINETTTFLKGIAEKKNITLDINSDKNLIITANKDRIKQMLINLIENAIKYNNEGGYVSVSACKSSGRVTISVKDNGIGIPSEHVSRIFERFYRVDKGRSRNMGGTGLGLSIVKHIVNLYNGDVKVQSTPGVGTEFIVQLPI